MNVTLIEEMQFARHLMAFAKDPSNLDRIRKLSNVAGNLRDTTAAEAIVRHAMQDPGYRRLYESQYAPPLPDTEALAQLPRDTFGYAYARHIEENNLSVDFIANSMIKDPQTQFLSDRVLRTHDIVHVLTGYDAGKVGELAVQAFCTAQLPSGIHVAILTAGLLHLLREDLDQIPAAFDAITQAYQRGQEARFVLGVAWEWNWERPLADLRRLMKLDVTTAFREAA